jgi:capsid protein
VPRKKTTKHETLFTTALPNDNVIELGYDATKPSPRRSQIEVNSMSEDNVLDRQGRLALSSRGRDLLRNLSIAGFAIRRHLLHVAKFDFKCSIPGQPEYNALVKSFFYNWSRRQHCDIAGRYSLRQMIRLIETHRIIDGDVAILKTESGQLQLIEGDRIANPPDLATTAATADYKWTQGVQIDCVGKAQNYAIHKRNQYGSFEFESTIPAEDIILCGYQNRIDQIRGVSLIAPAVNQFQDVYEGIEYALAKAKVSQLLGLITTVSDRNFNVKDPVAENENLANDRTRMVREKFGPGTLHLDLLPGDDAKLLAEGTPSNQFQDFVENVVRVALAALDIPYSFFDGSKTNYYGSRGALDNYIEESGEKQIGLSETLNEITDWRIRIAVRDMELPPPPKGMTVDEMLWYCDWIGARMPKWRLIEDAKGYHVALQDGLISPQDITGMHGLDYSENIEEIREAKEIADRNTVQLAFTKEITTSNIGV